jgi:hypothetical protein
LSLTKLWKEGMTELSERAILAARLQKAQERLAEVDSGAVQTIPGDVAFAQIRQLAKQ